MLSKYGIDEIYFHDNLPLNLLEKLAQRAILTLDADDSIVEKYNSHDIILIFHRKEPTNGLIYRFLRGLEEDANREEFVKSNTLFNEEELFSAIKHKKFVLVTHRSLPKEIYHP